MSTATHDDFSGANDPINLTPAEPFRRPFTEICGQHHTEFLNLHDAPRLDCTECADLYRTGEIAAHMGERDPECVRPSWEQIETGLTQNKHARAQALRAYKAAQDAYEATQTARQSEVLARRARNDARNARAPLPDVPNWVWSLLGGCVLGLLFGLTHWLRTGR